MIRKISSYRELDRKILDMIIQGETLSNIIKKQQNVIIIK